MRACACEHAYVGVGACVSVWVRACVCGVRACVCEHACVGCVLACARMRVWGCVLVCARMRVCGAPMRVCGARMRVFGARMRVCGCMLVCARMRVCSHACGGCEHVCVRACGWEGACVRA